MAERTTPLSRLAEIGRKVHGVATMATILTPEGRARMQRRIDEEEAVANLAAITGVNASRARQAIESFARDIGSDFRTAHYHLTREIERGNPTAMTYVTGKEGQR